MDPKAAIALAVQVSLILIVASAGLRSNWRDLGCALRDPGLLLRGAIAVNVVVPVAAVLACLALPVDPLVKFGIVVMAVSPLAPLVPGKMFKAGAGSSTAVGLFFSLILLAVVIVPATVWLMKAALDISVEVPVMTMARLVITSILLPLGAGLVIAAAFPGLAPRLAKISGLLGNLLLLPFLVGVLYLAGGAMMGLVGDGTVAAIILTVIAALAGGHLLGAPEATNRVALAQAAATRHPGIAAIIAHSYSDDRRIMLAVLLFLIVSVILSGVYQAWAGRRIGTQDRSTTLEPQG